MINIIKNLNKNLTKTRDYLLPKLISGKVDVSDLDIDTSRLDDYRRTKNITGSANSSV